MTVVMEMYREGIAVGEKRGEERGAIWGRNEGKIEGRTEGRTEAITAIISLMQQNGFSTEDICKNTGLSKEEIERLITEKKK